MRYPFADRVKKFKSSAVRDILSVIQKGDVISFAGGMPFEDFFPNEAVERAFSKVFQSGKSSMQYGLTEGFMPLRELLSDQLKQQSMRFDAENILLTTGSQQAIDLFSRAMLSPGDVVLTEDPTYLAALQVFQSYEAEIIAVESDEDGMDPDDLEQKMRQYRPKFVYIVPTFSNPEGKVWSAERRQLLLNLAQRFNVLIFEDDPYGEIKFDDQKEFTPIAAFDEEGTHVVYTSTISKTVVPALRIGWVAGPYQVIRMMAQVKQCSDLHSSSIDQQALYYLLQDFDLKGHIRMLREEYYKRMVIMQDYLKKIESDSISWIEPQGGMFLWVTLGEQVDTTVLLMDAIKEGVAYVPGAPFYVANPRVNTLRLNFTHATPELIQLGMDRLTTVLNRLQPGNESPPIL
ncbi:aminotransferase [Ammoniphilus oxalaticus]|uniref:Aminotransferase n=1 Tax=Ammoniphilus oxalaticus TaxID=66863 RepID=A0A419SQF7_9BACL|nr:PLP-dependent aminotransferase family protein [Ammoniphilus oxalaticus]RKD26726.1 aminotransferase [Ammoniphilus oxalaticus]